MPRLLPLGIIAALLLPAAAAAAGLPDFDVRDGLGAATRSVKAPGARAALRRGHALTAPAGAPARHVARRYLATHARALGLDPAALGTPRVVRAPGGLRTVRFTGAVGGIPTFDSAVTVGVDRRGRIVSVAGRPDQHLAIPSTRPRVSAAAAMAAFGRLTSQAVGARTAVRPGPRRETRFGNDFARLVVFAGPPRDRLAWHVYLGDYDGVVDATTGAVLRRQYLVKDAAAASVFPNYPGARAGGNQVAVDFETLNWLAPGATALNGSYVHAYADTLSADDPGVDGEVPRTANGDFVYPFTSFGTAPPRCAAFAACGWNSSMHTSWQTNLRQTTVQTFFLDNVFYEHLNAAPIGFDKASGNFAETDPVLAETDDGAATFPPSPLPLISTSLNNANMATPPDGSSPRMQMYLGAYDDLALFGLFRDYNNGDDAATVFHEYTHGLTNRLVTNADGSGALDSAQAGAMGEAWGDWYAFDYLVRHALTADTAAGGEIDIGIYSDVAPHATRTQGLDCALQSGGGSTEPCPGTASAGPGGYTYGDFGNISGSGAEVHADGEIWAETLWDLRTALVASEGGQAAGSDLAEALVTGGLRLAPPEPSFLDMRDAIMQTDVALFGGAHIALLWTVFAGRGMGADATSTGGDDTAPNEGFKVPEAAGLNGSLSASPATVAAGGKVDFTATFTTGSAPKGFAWDFDGDGKTDATSDTPQTSHVYPKAGSYLARVKVTDTQLASGTATAKVTVTGDDGSPGPGPGPSGTPTPSPGGGDNGSARLRVVKTGKHGRYTVRVNCQPSCVVRVKAQLTKATARKIGLTNRRVRSLTRTVRGSARVRVHVGKRLRREARARGVLVLRVLVNATAEPPTGGATHRRRTVRIRV